MQKLLKLIMWRNSAKLQQSDGITHWVAMGLKSSKEIVPYMTASIDSKATEINYVPKFRQTATQRVRTWQCCAAAFRLIQLHAVLPSTKANPITWHENNSLAFWCVGLEKQSTQHTQQHTHHLLHELLLLSAANMKTDMLQWLLCVIVNQSDPFGASCRNLFHPTLYTPIFHKYIKK